MCDKKATPAIPFELELTSLLNKHSMENNSNTPDFILAKYMLNCLKAFSEAVCRREEWYGRKIEKFEPVPITEDKPCPNCKEIVEICGCMRNICKDCGLSEFKN